MGRHSLRTDTGITLVVEYVDALELQARWLLCTVARLFGGEELRDGSSIDVGWVILTARGQGRELILCEPDFDGDPFHHQSPTVTTTLMVLSQQRDVLARVGNDGTPTRWNEKVVLAKGCLSARKLYLERKADVSAGDSGWYIGPVGEDGPTGELEARYAYQLLKERPELAQALALPPGYLVVFNDSTIEAVLNPEERDVWAKSDAEH